MKYQKITNFLDNKPNQPTKFRTENWFEINGDSRGIYPANIRLDEDVLKTSFVLVFRRCLSSSSSEDVLKTS